MTLTVKIITQSIRVRVSAREKATIVLAIILPWRGVAQAVEHLLCQFKGTSSNPSPTKKKRNLL
jgi:hypothetical protein